jgi:hypothetical protein
MHLQYCAIAAYSKKNFDIESYFEYTVGTVPKNYLCAVRHIMQQYICGIGMFSHAHICWY